MVLPIDSQIKVVRQELSRRKKIFPKLVKDGKMTQDRSDSEIMTMLSVLHTLTQLKGMVCK